MAECMVKKNRKLLTIPNSFNMIPLVRAYCNGYWHMARYLYSETPVEYLWADNGPSGATIISQSFASKEFGKSFKHIWLNYGHEFRASDNHFFSVLSLCPNTEMVTPKCHNRNCMGFNSVVPKIGLYCGPLRLNSFTCFGWFAFFILEWSTSQFLATMDLWPLAPHLPSLSINIIYFLTIIWHIFFHNFAAIQEEFWLYWTHLQDIHMQNLVEWLVFRFLSHSLKINLLMYFYVDYYIF